MPARLGAVVARAEEHDAPVTTTRRVWPRTVPQPSVVRASPRRPIRSRRSRRKVVGPERFGRAAQRGRGPLIGTRRPADSEIDAAGVERLEHGELLGHHDAAWFGSMTPPEPTRIRSVAAATWAISTDGTVLATLRMLWCSATQNRWKPSASAWRAMAVV